MAIKTVVQDGKTYASIYSLSSWDKNPRTINTRDFERLKKQIQELGQHTPLIVDENGTVYGGNMRLKAYQELGIEDVWVSPISGDENKKLQYALSSNDRAGYYDEDMLRDLVDDFDIDWQDFAVDL